MHLFLAPHYDDAVYSCGGTIYQLVQAGQTVRIYTVMGGGLPTPLPDTPIVRVLHTRWQAGKDPVETRRAEDNDAIHALDAEAAYNSSLPDCVYRVSSGDGTALYPSEESIFGEVHPDDPAIAQLEFKVFSATNLWREIRFDEQGNYQFAPENTTSVTLYAPIAIGNHVDHQITRNWAFKLRQAHPHLTLKFYEDFPYVRDATPLEKILASFPAAVEKETVYLTDAAIQARIHSMAVYRSQFSTFWADEALLKQDVTQVMTIRGAGRPAEIYYVVK
jgi:LmbE family N-acetylglucosaminyl deacetylase